MVDTHAVFTVLAIYLAGVVIPGPNFVAVVHKAVASTRASALALVAGIVVVNIFWASCAIAGIGIVFAAFPWVALVVKILGAGYLIWFGSRLIINAGNTSAVLNNKAVADNFRQSFVQGVITNIGNPKSMAFYAAIFSTAAPAHVSSGTFISMLAVVGIVATLWYGSVAIMLSLPAISTAYRRAKKVIDRFCGSVIVLMGIRQIVR
ncbi:LysE family translocator [Rouxiella sp. S1S-2]|uniref:LysE family translocator n=1 Tax=Rouxiella sp. S1S-2 TaxID=2653856 RepID=UPI00126590DA|nr:LysE family translocator [Rouxiella sp. S1S-2]KAB7896827.1 LysE family translocator [Rouxiella sp. S1S-2]